MVTTSLNLNSLTIDSNGRVSFSGLSSGIDFQKAVDAIIAAKKVPIDTMSTKVDTNNKQITALKSLQTLVTNLKSSLDTLRGAVSVGGANDIFKSKAAFAAVSRIDGATPAAAADLIGVNVTNAAVVGSHTLEVLRVAAAEKDASDAQASTTDPLGLAGTFQINGQDITVSAGDSLQDVADRINNANTGDTATKVTASIVSPSAGESYMVLTADDTGTAITYGDAGGVLQSLGVLDAGLAAKNQLQAATTAQFKADGLIDKHVYTSEALANPNAALSTTHAGATYPGSFDITGSGGTATINYTASSSLTDIMNAVNLETGTTNVQASIQTDAAGSRLVLTELSDATMSVTDTSGLLGALGVNNQKIIERSSNTVSDLFAGTTINLFQAEEGTKIKIDVEQDLSKVQTQVGNFVTAYNALKVFLNTQTEVDPATGQPLSADAVLSNSQTVKNLASSLSNMLGSGATGVSSAFQVLDQIGITLVDNTTLTDQTQASTLQIDSSKLNDALLNNPDAVRKLFALNFSSSDSRVTLIGYTGLPTYNASGYTLNLTYDSMAGQVSGANVNGAGAGTSDGSVTINGNSLTATSTTGANGLQLLYTGNTDLSGVQLNFSLGLATQMYYLSTQTLDATSGSLQNEINTLTDQNSATQDRIDRGNASLDYQRTQLLNKFINMETALSQMNDALNQVQQLTNSLFGNSSSSSGH
ncbi:MAG: flagellar filament capping protein FliD [Candidatus Eiseniibacteriota bacterium]